MKQSEKVQKDILTIRDSLYNQIAPRFKQAGIPFIQFHVDQQLSENEYFISALFRGSNFEEIYIDVSVNGDVIQMVTRSGSLEFISSMEQEEMFAKLSSSVFKRIAQEIDLIKKSKGEEGLRKINGDLVSLEYVTYADFEMLDVSDIDFALIYFT